MAIRKALDCLAALAMTVLLIISTPAAAQTLPDRPATPVLDQAKLLRAEQVVDIESKAAALHERTGRTFFVATVNGLDGLSIEDYGGRLLRHWKVGDAERDDGVILIVAPKERKVRIETGYGAEGFLPDILAGRIIRDTIVPKFKAGDLAGGTAAGADAIIRQMSVTDAEADASIAAAERQATRTGAEVGFIPVIVIILIFFFIIASIARRAGGRRYHARRSGIDPWVVLWGLNELGRASRGRGGWGGGSWGGGGGFGGGGGGSFGGFGGMGGGGGASGSW